MTRVAEQGLSYNRFHVTAPLFSHAARHCSQVATTTPWGSGRSASFPARSPVFCRRACPKDCAPFVRALQGNGYTTAGFGKWHMTPRSPARRGRAVRPLAERLGVRPLLGMLGEAGQYDPVITQDNTTLGVPGVRTGSSITGRTI